MEHFPELAEYPDNVWAKRSLPRLGGTIRFLLDRAGLKPIALARILGTTATHIGVLKRRAAQAEDVEVSRRTQDHPESDASENLGIREESDPNVLSEIEEVMLFEDKISRASSIYEHAIRTNDYVAGAKKLKGLRSDMGRPHVIPIRRAIADLNIKRAHLLIDGGHCYRGANAHRLRCISIPAFKMNDQTTTTH